MAPLSYDAWWISKQGMVLAAVAAAAGLLLLGFTVWIDRKQPAGTR
jgi:hypothetical protein